MEGTTAIYKNMYSRFSRRNSDISGKILLFSPFYGGKLYYEKIVATFPVGKLIGRGMGSYFLTVAAVFG